MFRRAYLGLAGRREHAGAVECEEAAGKGEEERDEEERKSVGKCVGGAGE